MFWIILLVFVMGFAFFKLGVLQGLLKPLFVVVACTWVERIAQDG
jgi:hypothetical protein